MLRGTRRAALGLPRQAAPAASGAAGSHSKGTASQRSRPRTGHGSAGAASRWRAPAGRWAARPLLPAPRGGDTRARTAEAPVPPPSAPQGARRWAPASPVPLVPLTPHPPSRGALRRRAARKVGRPPRAAAGDGFRLLRGAPVSECGPPPTPRRRRPRLQPQNPRGFRTLRAAPALPLPPRGRPGGRKPQPGPGGMKV